MMFLLLDGFVFNFLNNSKDQLRDTHKSSALVKS